MGRWVFLGGLGWVFFKCHSVPKVHGKEVSCRGLLLVGRIELDQTWLWENFLQREEGA